MKILEIYLKNIISEIFIFDNCRSMQYVSIRPRIYNQYRMGGQQRGNPNTNTIYNFCKHIVVIFNP
jgi:hypothetical protein